VKGTRPRSRAFAGRARPVTERSEGNPRSGLTGRERPATPATERAGGLRPRYAEQLNAFGDSLIEWLNETTGEIRLVRAQDVLFGFELERALLWHIYGRPDGRGGVLRPGEPGWLAAGGYTVRDRP
jgi:hypothetical protein